MRPNTEVTEYVMARGLPSSPSAYSHDRTWNHLKNGISDKDAGRQAERRAIAGQGFLLKARRQKADYRPNPKLARDETKQAISEALGIIKRLDGLKPRTTSSSDLTCRKGQGWLAVGGSPCDRRALCCGTPKRTRGRSLCTDRRGPMASNAPVRRCRRCLAGVTDICRPYQPPGSRQWLRFEFSRCRHVSEGLWDQLPRDLARRQAATAHPRSRQQDHGTRARPGTPVH
jgi:hypothetical protein